MSIVEKIMDGLIADIGNMPNEAYLSEADFQFQFANKAKELGAKNVIIEYPFKFVGEKARKHIDVFFEFEETMYFVELKYKTRLFKGVTRHVCNGGFSLANQYAQNDSMFAFRKDIERMENLRKTEGFNSAKTYCVFLTNNQNYWDVHDKEKGIAAVALTDNSVIGGRENQEGYKNKTLNIENTYKLVWKDFKKLGEDQKMRYLIVECK